MVGEISAAAPAATPATPAPVTPAATTPAATPAPVTPAADATVAGALESLITATVEREVTTRVEAWAAANPGNGSRRVQIELVDPDDREPVALPATAHDAIPDALVTLQAMRLCALIGPAGTGKTFGAHMLAEMLGATPHTIVCNGSMTASGFAGLAMPGASGNYVGTGATAALDATRDGEDALLIIDEWDRLDECVAVALHALLTSDGAAYVSTPARPGMPLTTQGEGTLYVVCTANTCGEEFGDFQYSAASKLDAATLDRIRLARIWWDYDATVEAGYVEAYGLPTAIADRFWDMRETATKERLDLVVSTRAFKSAGMLYRESPEYFGADNGQPLVDRFLMGQADSVRAKLGGTVR